MNLNYRRIDAGRKGRIDSEGILRCGILKI